MAGQETRYGIADLAELGGVSRRTVRYYVQQGLLPAPLGVGRGEHYGPAHLARLLQVKRLQEHGRSLDDIRAELQGAPGRAGARRAATSPPSRSVWRRLTPFPGVELHVAADVRLPSPAQLEELTRALRRAFAFAAESDEDRDA